MNTLTPEQIKIRKLTKNWRRHWLWKLDEALEAGNPLRFLYWGREIKEALGTLAEGLLFSALTILGPPLVLALCWMRIVLAPIVVTLETVYERIRYRKVIAKWKAEAATE